MSSVYRVTASRDEDWWGLLVSGPGLKRAYPTQVKRLEHAGDMARDLVALMLDVEESDLDAIFEVTLSDDELADELAETHHARAEADRKREEATKRTRATARHMRERGYTHRDIAVLLHVSHQAVGKMLDEAAPVKA